MAQLITVRLSRVDAQPWGLRLQGGKDFGTPLVVQKVNIGSIADQAGLIAGDAVIKVNNVDVFSLRHKDAQDIIVRSGNSFEITVQRGGSTWRPSVTPTGAVPSPTPSYGNHINTVTKTSLAHKQQDSSHIGCGYNNAARPFQNGNEPVKSIVNKQYNTPVGIYSEESIAETLSAQAEVLAGGVLGVNFKKNEKVYNSAGSEVLKALQESENDPADPDEHSHSQLRPVTPVVTKHVHAPENRPAPPSTGGLPAGQNICSECERLIVGVFVRIKDKNLHVDCFKCATCGTSLKNQGYFNLNNKLYCDIHAKMAAINHPPPGTEGYKPVPIAPNTKLSASTISAALNAHHGNLPHQNGTSHNNNLPSNLGSPKPYSYGSGPPPAGPKSPSSYPPPNWSQPKPQAYAPPQQTYTPPQPTYTPSKPTFAPTQNYSSPSSNLGSNTLPRPVGQSAPETSNPQPAPQTHSHQYDTFEEDSVDEFSRPSTSAFSWPPPPDDDHDLPTASPLYVAPPETQRVQVKTINYSENVDKPTVAWTAQQSRSAPELTIHNLKEHNEAESCSESYTSTCTTTTTTSEEYQKMYRAHQAEFGCDLSVSDMDYHADAEMASMAQQYGSFSSASTDLISFAGRKSVQECTDALSNKVDTCQLVRYIKELESANQKPVKKVEFADPVHEAINDNKKISKMEVMLPPPSPKPLPPSNISNPVPKEWTSLMVQALTTAPSQPYHVSEIQIESCNLPCQQINTQNDVCYKTCPGKESCDQVSCSSVEIGKVERQENIKTSTNLTQTENVQNGAYNYNQGENNFLRLSDASCSNHTIEEAHFAKEEPLQRSYMSSGLTVASPYPVEWTKPFEEPVPLPEETVPYFPPPIDMSPYEKSDYGKKSPFIDALTTAPFRSYTPFEHDVITQLEDLPTPTQQLSMIDALTVAPTNSYHELNQELPEVTPNEQILLDEKERLERQAKEVSEIIAQTIESQMDKQISAFAKFSGFRSVHPFKPKQDSIAVATVSAGTQSTEVSEVNESKNLVTSTYSSSEAHSAQNAVSFPPPPAVKCKSYVQSGLHIPKTIPKYQRQWFNLPSQSPIRTPEPPELKENVPLAFVDVPHETSESVQKPVAVTVSSASITKETQSYSVASQSQQYRTTVSTTIPSIKEFRTEPVSMPFESLDDHHERERAVSPYRAHTPSMINKPAPAIPYYQQNLVAEECSATSSLLFDPRIQSPNPDRAKSPAPGPPPNPLRIHAPRIKSPDLTERYDTNTQSIDTSISNQYSTLPTLSHYQTFNQSGLQSYVAKPEVVKQTQSENVSIQSRSTESHLNDQNRSDFRSSSTAQIGNTQIQRNTRVVEEFEHSQKVKTIEVYKSSGGPPIRSITAEPAVIQPTVSKTSCFLQRAGSIQPDHAEEKVNVKSSGPGFVAREARRLSTNSQYKADLAEYQSSFPKLTCETSPSAFPIKNFHPIMEEPKFQAYNVNKRAGESAPPPGYQQIPKAILTKSTQQLSKKLSQVTDSSASSTLTSGTTAMTQSISSSTPYKPPIAIPVPAFKPPIPSANDFKPTQSAANNFKPTSSSGPGFKPPNTTIPSAVVNNTTPASAGPNKGLTFGATSAPKRGRGILSKAPGPGGRIPQCGCCNAQIRGPFITALGRIWCPDHFVCVSQNCRRPLADIGFVEEKGELYCEYCFEKYLAPPCDKCGAKIKGDCLNAIGKHYHPECFVCTYCGKLFGNSPFFLEEGQAYCETDWNELFTTKCFACGFPVEAGDRWVEALSHNYHSQCFNCTTCKKNLEGQSFFAKGGRPFCKNHAR